MNTTDVSISAWSSRPSGSWQTWAPVGAKAVHTPTGLEATCDKIQSFYCNRRKALEELESLVMKANLATVQKIIFDPTISFRAWDKTTKRMMEVGGLEFLRGGIKVYGTGVPIGNGWVTEANGFKHPCDAILMEYIGFRDTRQNQIYEDDIAVRKWNDGTIKNIIVVKRTKSGSFNINQQLLAAVCIAPSGAIAHGFEIMGNLHKDPQLLTNTTKGFPDD